ncbi:MAG: metalloregulator ArsR/SmtB family transcription factor [Spirochaetales bacterium]
MTQCEHTAKIFKALSDEKRIAIIECLRTGEKCACELISSLEIAQSALSYHMKILCESGLVECRTEGKWTHYKISKNGSEEAVQILADLTAVKNTLERNFCRKI